MKRWRPLTWLLVSVACFLGAAYFWRLGEQWRHQAHASVSPKSQAQDQRPEVRSAQSGGGITVVKSGSTAPFALLSLPGVTNKTVATAAAAREERLKYRLHNTTQTVGELTRNDHAILLENALIDSSAPLGLAIPDALKSPGDPGSYIVQSRGPINSTFRAQLAQAGAKIVSYIPNNAYLVRVSAAGAQELNAQPGTQAVVPFEPYYKLDTTLLGQFLANQPSSDNLNLLVFGDAQAATLAALKQLGAQVVEQSPSPFGTMLVVQHATDVAAVARIPGVQRVETHLARMPANDLTRARLHTAADTLATNNYLGLSGVNVTLDQNDTGVDATHPDLVNRVTSLDVGALTDTDGHGTHVAGIMIGDGTKSSTVTNASGSIMPGTNNQFRGEAPRANLFIMPINSGFSDFQLQEAAAQTNALISNNSWGYGDQGYDIASASFDAAVRDALPEVTGSQPVLFVFAAGNSGGGDDNGLNGSPESVLSPGTAKNVLTVGALEAPRNITNNVVIQGVTNQPWAGMTDSSNQVASFSSRGNVGIGIEGDTGRFKPDVVAPGVFVVSTRSQQWDTNAYFNPTNYTYNTFQNQTVETNTLNNYDIFVPNNCVQLIIAVTPITPQVDLPIYVRQSDIPTTTTYDVKGTGQVSLPPDHPLSPVGTTWFYSIGNPTNVTVSYDVQTELVTTNDFGNYFDVLHALDDGLGTPPWYRYESGTSMATPAVSGMLALIQDFFTNQLHAVPSPALLKAIVINGARSVNSIYDFQVQNSINYQGWGLVNLTNCVPSLFSNATPVTLSTTLATGPSPVLWYDQSPTNALATGQSHTYQIKVDPSANAQPLRVTLVWTDPAGNPAAGVKLVNNLDLVVTNLDDPSNPLIYFGNDISSGANFTFPWVTNTPPNVDVINNVENVYLSPTLGTNYSVTVISRAVNVNAVTAQTNDIVQDYALVISSGSGGTNPPLTLVADSGVVLGAYTNLTVMTNQFNAVDNPGISGELLLGQHVGASSPLIGTNTVAYTTNTELITLGQTNQWHFYVFTNTTTFTNAAFATFAPPDLSLPRMGVTNYQNTAFATRPEADIDLFVSTDPGLLSLDPNAVANAFSSVGRGGTEVVVISNAVQNQVYYIGVQSQDQLGAEYGFFGVFSQLPFGSQDKNGNWYIHGINAPSPIPDGSPAKPGAANILAIMPGEIKMRRVVVTNVLEHENFGDLLGNLSHNQKFAVLNNHTFGNGNYLQTLIYEDNGENNIAGSQHTDGPGGLTSFIGEEGAGLWLLTEVDNALSHTGRVDNLYIKLEPQQNTNNGVILTIQPNSFVYDFVDVPPEATNLTICVYNQSASPLPLQLYVSFEALPTQTSYDYTKVINPPGDCLSISQTDLPPLHPGRYYIGVYNPNSIAQTIDLTVTLNLSLNGVAPLTFSSTGTNLLRDDAVGYSTINITNQQTIVSAAVGVVLNSPRDSDLALTLISPGGERFLLMEDRGGLFATNMGHLNIVTNFFGQTSAGGANANTNIIGPVLTSGILLINYNFYTVPDQMDVYYDGQHIFGSGYINGAGQFSIPYGPGQATNIVIVMNQGNNPRTTAWVYTPEVVSEDYSYLTFTEDTSLASMPIKFAVPPYDNVSFSTNYNLSDFEAAPAGEYFAPTNVPDAFGGWNLATNGVAVGTNLVSELTNEVSVVADPTNALAGTNFLALADGSMTRTVQTTPGVKYSLSFWYRGPGIVGWWEGEGNANDNSDAEGAGNNGVAIGGPLAVSYPAGEVNQAFQLDGTNGYIQIPQSPSLDVGKGDGLTVEGWIKPSDVSTQRPLVEWLAPIPTNSLVTNLVKIAGPFLNPNNLNYYYLLGTNSWTASEAWAVAMGGHLAEIDSLNDQTWVYNTFSTYGGTNRTLWIGLNDVALPGTFVWSDGNTNVPFTDWLGGAPTNCGPNQHYTCLINPTNVPNGGLWLLKDNLGRTCGGPPITPIHGVVEVPSLRTNGVQFWVSVTKNVGTGPGCLYADLVDTNGVSHRIASAPGLVTNNIYQHVALTYNRWSGVANLYYQGTNVATTNLGNAFVPQTGGDVLLGKNITGQTNDTYDNFAGGLDEMSIYQRALSPAEIAAIYRVSALSTNRTVGKFDPNSGPPLSLAEAQVIIGGVTNVIFGDNTNWLSQVFTFTAATNSIQIQITGTEPGMLLDSFGLSGVSQANLYYLPEQSLQDLVGQNAAGTWTLEVRDSRVGATNAASDIVSWQMQFIFLNTSPLPLALLPYQPVTNNVPPCQIAYFTVDVPSWANFATNILVSSSQPVSVLFNQTTPPTGGNPGDFTLLSSVTSGLATLSTNGVPPLQRGQRYYLGVTNSCANSSNATVVLEVDYDITTLTNELPYASVLQTNDTERYFAFDVSPNAIEATFQLLKLSGNADLVVSKGVPLPTLLTADYGSFNSGTADENIYVLTNSSPVALSAGRWYLGVFKRSAGKVNYTVLAKELFPPAPTIIELTNGVPLNFTAGPGAALTNFFRFTISNAAPAVRFELYNLSGNGDLIVQTNALPLAPPFFLSSQQPGINSELIQVHTNSAMTNLNAQWYLGVPNNEATNISFTILAVLENNGCFPAFPGAEGAGACANGGRGGDVYHVINLNDSGPGSLRDAVSPLAQTNRTVVFDVSGTITLLSPLVITNSYLTLAGQTAPGDGITVKGFMTTVESAHDVIIRYLRFRPGDGNCPTNENALLMDQSTDVIADHISASWSLGSAVSAQNSANLTVQWSMIADSLTNSCNTNEPGFGSTLRYGTGELSWHHNLYADNDSANPRLGDNLTLDFVNNVLHNWGSVPGFSADDTADNPSGFTNQMNYVANYLIAGHNTVLTNRAFVGGSTNTWIYQTNNVIESDLNTNHTGQTPIWGLFTNLFTKFSVPFALPPITTDPAYIAYERVLDFVGSQQPRDAVDLRIVNHVRTNAGVILNSQTQVGGWPSLNTIAHPADTDQDGIPDYWSITLGFDPTVPHNNNDRDQDGYTDLEEYNNWLASPHALTLSNTPVTIDLYAMAGNSGNLTFAVVNGTNGTVVLTNTLATFTPSNNYSGFASFGFFVTNNDTVASFGPVTVSVFVSGAAIVTYPTIIDLTNNVPFSLTAGPGSALTNLFRFTTIDSPGAVVFELYALSGNGDLVVQTNAFPIAPNIFASSQQPGTNSELIYIPTNGVLTNLNAQWYLGVPNNDPGLITYTILARELVSVPTIIDLTNNVPLNFTAGPGPALTNFFRFTITNAPGAVSFQLYNQTGNGDLVLQTNALPFAPVYFAASQQLGTSNESILELTNAGLPNLTAQWYLGVPNNDPALINYTILASILTTIPQAPYANSLPATLVTGTSAHLNGMATPNGLPSTAWFQWGGNNLYGNTTPPITLGTNYSVTYVTNQISGLALNAPYHFRLVVSNAVAVTYGYDQIFDEGNVSAWGASYIGQTFVPPGLSNVVAISAGYDFSMALQKNGTVIAWGDNTFNQTNVPAGLNAVVGIAGGQKHAMALKSDGTVAVWGANFFHQTNVPPTLTNAVAIASGGSHCLAVRSDGTVAAWGYNGSGEATVPAGLSNVVAVAGGNLHSLALKNDGTVVGWGYDGDGEIDVPPGLNNVVAIAAGEYHSLALKNDGTVVAWGFNLDGETNVPPGLNRVLGIAGGGYHSLAVRSNGRVVAWGYDGSGETNVPSGITNAVAVAGGDFHSLALSSLFNVNGTNTPPVFVATPSNVVIAALSTLLVTNLATDAQSPPQTLTYLLTVAPTNAIINVTNAVITWTPTLAQAGTTNVFTTVVTDNGAPPLSATNSFKVVVTNAAALPTLVTLTNGVPYFTTNSLATTNVDYYHYLVSTNAARAQFEINHPTGAVTLVARHGLPLPNLSSYDYLSAAGGTNDDLIVLFTNSVPVPLAPGDWYLAAVNVSGGPVAYSIKATDWPATGLPILITGTGLSSTNSFCITWTSLPGVHYVVEGVTALPSTNWVAVSPVITAVTNLTTWCIGLPSPYHFFRVREGELAGPVSIPVPPVITGVTRSTNGVNILFRGTTGQKYQVQWTPVVAPTAWLTFSNIITSVTTQFSFFDDGTQTGGLGPTRFYRAFQLP